MKARRSENRRAFDKGLFVSATPYTTICLAGPVQLLGPAAPTAFTSTLYTMPGVSPEKVCRAPVVCRVCTGLSGEEEAVTRQL